MRISSPVIHKSKAPDGGWGWVVVFGAFMLGFIADGFAFTTGVLFDYLLKTHKESEFKTSLFMSIMTGMIHWVGPLASVLSTAYGCRQIAILGSVLSAIGLFLSIGFDDIWISCITIGLITGSGLGLLYLPQIMIITIWFEKRLCFATGIAVSGTGLGTAVFSRVGNDILHRYGWKGSMIMWSGMMFTCIAFSSLFRNVPEIETKSSLKKALKETFDFVILKDIKFLYFTFANILSTSVYFVPMFYLKSHIKRTGIGSDSDAIFFMVVFGMSNALGRAMFGYIADNIKSMKRQMFHCLLIICYGLAIGLIASLGQNNYLMSLFVFAFGLTQGASACLYSGVIIDLFGAERVSNVFGIVNLITGFAAVIGPPLIGQTVDESTGYKTGFYISSALTIISGSLLFLCHIVIEII